MKLSRRKLLTSSVTAAFATLAATRVGNVLATPEEALQVIKDFSGGATPSEGGITLTAPEIAENGNTVPVSFSVDSPMTEDAYVESVMIVAEENPLPNVATFHFTPASGVAQASTRMRLARTQNVIAVAKMSDGSIVSDTKNVKVTIGGCGG